MGSTSEQAEAKFLMIEPPIEEIVQRIVERFRPRRIAFCMETCK